MAKAKVINAGATLGADVRKVAGHAEEETKIGIGEASIKEVVDTIRFGGPA